MSLLSMDFSLPLLNEHLAKVFFESPRIGAECVGNLKQNYLIITEKFMSKIFFLSSLCFLCRGLLVVCVLL